MLYQQKIRYIFILFVFNIITLKLFAQDTLQSSYDQLTLTKGTYIVSSVVTINDMLKVEPGVSIVFASGGTIVCNGNVLFDGKIENNIVLKSADSSWGNGIAIRTKNFQASVLFKFVEFNKLILPINFSNGWLRKTVNIEDCIFSNNEGTTSVLQVLTPNTNPGDDSTVIQFAVRNSLFFENRASLYFEDLSTNNFGLTIANNTFYGNRMPGYGKYSFSSNLIYGRSDKKTSVSASRFLMTDNSFLVNQMWDVDADTLVQRANFGVYGNSDSLYILNNFFGKSDSSGSRLGIYDYSSNYTSPKVFLGREIIEPAKSTPTHFFKIIADSTVLDEDVAYRIPLNGFRRISLYSNNSIRYDNLKIHYYYLKDSTANSISDTLLRNALVSVDSTNGNYQLNLQFNRDSLFRVYKGYLKIEHVRNQNYGEVPPVMIGQKAFLLDFYEQRKKIKLERIINLDSLINKKKPLPATIFKFKKKYEIGLVGAYAIYYGTLANKSLFQNDFNSSFGAEFRYNLQSHISFSLGFFTTTLTGSDLRSNDSTKIARGMSFKTKLMGISAQLEIDFIDNKYYSSRKRLRPSIGFGVDYIKFNPMGEYLGKLYNLQPLGTGGQTLDNAKIAPYKLSTLGAPVTAQLRYFLNKKTIFSVFATYHLAFSDYLDDVGPTPYPDLIQVEQKNGDNGAAAAYFANPTRRAVTPNQLRSGLTSGNDSFLMLGFKLSKHF